MTQELKVLLIDDSTDDLEFYGDLLRKCPSVVQVHTALDGEKGLALFRSNPIDCVFIDFNLPEMNGLEILEHLQHDKSGFVATILLTGQPHQKVQAEAARKGAFNYMVKSEGVTAVQLEGAILKAVSSAQELNAQREG